MRALRNIPSGARNVVWNVQHFLHDNATFFEAFLGSLFSFFANTAAATKRETRCGDQVFLHLLTSTVETATAYDLFQDKTLTSREGNALPDSQAGQLCAISSSQSAFAPHNLVLKELRACDNCHHRPSHSDV